MWSFLFNQSQPSFEAMWVLAKKRFKSQSLHETPTAKQTEISKAVRLSQQIYPVIFKAYKTRMLPKREERLPLQKSDLFHTSFTLFLRHFRSLVLLPEPQKPCSGRKKTRGATGNEIWSSPVL